jgi:tRNA 2-selenouridine synthase
VAKNAAAHLEGPLADKPGGWQPLVYCWRGGQRSGSFASILSQIGWRVEVVQGGYKSWRRLVVEALYDQPFAHRLMVLDGNTGTAKTEVLALLAAQGVQVVDLEGLANHRGSLFGHMGEQPSQKAFEGRLALALARLDPSRPVVVEAESAKVGECRLPPKLWRAMVTAPRISIEAPRAARAKYLVRAYADLVADVARLDAVVASLAPAHPREVIAEWRAMAAAGAFVDLAEGLMARHYDPRYGKHRARMEVPVTEVAVEALDDLESLTDRIAGLIAAY